jgi:hypothetical protein
LVLDDFVGQGIDVDVVNGFGGTEDHFLEREEDEGVFAEQFS